MFLIRRGGAALLVVLAVAALLFLAAAAAHPDGHNFDAKYSVELRQDNFHAVVKDPSKHVFVVFHAPWCGHCVRMLPQWDQFAAEMRDTRDVVVAHIDAATHRGIAEEYGLRAFPTLRLFTKGNKDGVPYQGPRDVLALKSFLKSFIS